jgi:hypothetical protein
LTRRSEARKERPPGMARSPRMPQREPERRRRMARMLQAKEP